MKLFKVMLYLIAIAAQKGLTSASFFDYLWTGEENNTDIQGREISNNTNDNCQCTGVFCNCCINFELAYVDLGGPGCVQMKYFSENKQLMVNVSYGKSLVHGEKINITDPKPVCTPNKVAQVCAKFSKFVPHENAEMGCLSLEPKLFGAVTSHFQMNCFSIGSEGMKIEARNQTLSDNQNSTEDSIEESQTDTNNLSEELLSMVNETAQQGLAFIGNLLGLAFGQNSDKGDNLSNSTLSVNSTEH